MVYKNAGNINFFMDEKEKIRERYKGIDSDKTFVIPAKPKPSIYDDSVNRRVAVYARVSTDNINQTSSYELQKITIRI